MASGNSKRRLLVEGTDDKHSILHLMKRHGVDWDRPELPDIEDCGGYSQLRAGVSSVLLKSSEVVGVVIDANSSPADRWTSIHDRMAESGIEMPKQPQVGGWVSESAERGCRCGVWMMPDNAGTGALEDFLETLVPRGDGCRLHAEQCTDEASRLGAPFAKSDRMKAIMHTWLAWREKPGQPFGQAITAKVLSADSRIATEFAGWFNRLFRSQASAD